MTDVDVMQGYIRDANPIQTLDDLDPDELTTFVASARTRRAAVMQAPTQHPVPTTPVSSPPQRRRKAWAFAAAFILIAAAIGVAALVTRDSGEAPVADEPTATTSAPDPIDAQGLTWTRLPHDEAVFNPTTGEDVMSDITVGGPGFVAVGTGVWVSEDGITWSLVTSAEWVGDMWSVTVGGPGLVAIGASGPGFSSSSPWTSEDGISWSKAVVEEAETLNMSAMFDVTAGGPGLVAVGGVSRDDSQGDAGWGGAVWTSVDGITWNRVSQDFDMLDNVTVGGPGLVAVGSSGWVANRERSAVWTSPDGLIWTPAEPPGSDVHDVTAGGPSLVAVGDAGNGGAAVWTSPDGFTWTRVPHDPNVFGGEVGDEQSMHTVTSTGSQLIALGGSEDSAGIVWTSVDGVTWTRSVIPGDGIVHSVAVADGGLIAVGEDDGAAAVWIATEG